MVSVNKIASRTVVAAFAAVAAVGCSTIERTVVDPVIGSVTGPVVGGAEDVVSARIFMNDAARYKQLAETLQANAPQLASQMTEITGAQVKEAVVSNLNFPTDFGVSNLMAEFPELEIILANLPDDFSVNTLKTVAGWSFVSDKALEYGKNQIPKLVDNAARGFSQIRHSFSDEAIALEEATWRYGCEQGRDKEWNQVDVTNLETIGFENPLLAEQILNWKSDEMRTVQEIDRYRAAHDSNTDSCNVEGYDKAHWYQFRLALAEKGCNDVALKNQEPDVATIDAYDTIKSQARQAFAALGTNAPISEVTATIRGLDDVTCPTTFLIDPEKAARELINNVPKL